MATVFGDVLVRTWRDSCSAIGRIAVGMARQGYDLQLTRYDETRLESIRPVKIRGLAGTGRASALMRADLSTSRRARDPADHLEFAVRMAGPKPPGTGGCRREIREIPSSLGHRRLRMMDMLMSIRQVPEDRMSGPLYRPRRWIRDDTSMAISSRSTRMRLETWFSTVAKMNGAGV
jgi:hypothetical protein